MSLINRVKGVVVEKIEKTFDDGSGGSIVIILKEDNTLLQFWANREFDDSIPEPIDTEEYDAADAHTFMIRTKMWDGKEKRHLVEVIR